ncbi:hypothetical protein IMG5_148260, partial [Ichthyophthirius multifiliis]
MNESFGIMDEGYFKSSGQILKWINDLLRLNVSKIESLGSGSVYCQVVDAIFPGKVPLSKVNWRAKLDYEFVTNLKILQNCFTKLGIKRYIEVEKLSKCKYQDNLEFIQWLMRFYEVNCNKSPESYDALERRKNVEPDYSFAEKQVIVKLFNQPQQNQQDNQQPAKSQARKPSTQVKQLEPALYKKVVNNTNANINVQNTQVIQNIKDIIQNQNISDSEKVAKIANLLKIESNQ